MSTAKLNCVFLLLVALFTSHAWACGKRDTQDKEPVDDVDPSRPSPGATVTACCVCGQPIDMVIVVSNQIQEPFFEFQTKIKNHPQQELLRQLEVAAVQDKRFRFTAEHFSSLGYMITGLSGLDASTENKTYWRISSHIHMEGLSLGVSQYFPSNNEIVMFNYTSYA